MRLLWFSHIVPYPPQGGNQQRSFNLIRQSSKTFQVDLVAFNQQGYSRDETRDYTRELKKHCSSVEIWDLPHPQRSVRWWLDLLWSPLRREPFTCRAFWSPRLAARWRQTLHDHSGALLHLDSPDLALYATAAGGFRKVMNHHNCESAMAFRRAEVEPNPLKKMYHRIHARKLARLERDVCHEFDVNTVVSELDAEALRAGNARAHIHIVENGTDADYFSPADVREEARSLIFAGSLDWYPNLSAIQFFLRSVWPLLKFPCPDVRLFLAGKNPSDSLLHRAGQDPNITVVSNPADMRPWLARASVFICPILDGGGTRLKILDAMAMAKPVVSTSVGCEGLHVKHGENILVADAPQDMAREILRAFEDGELRKRIAAAGRTLVETRYSWETIGRELTSAHRCALGGGGCEPKKETWASVEKSPDKRLEQPN
jgi:sugar transferase (PEP-CTERM/EpsH1 system associated)